MAGMNGLGRVFNVVPAAANLYISMKECSAISFVCTSANSDTFAFGEAKDSAGATKNLLADGTKGSFPTVYYESSDVDGSLAWVAHTLADDTTGAITTGHCIVVSVLSSMLDDGFNYVYCNPSSSGTVIAILHDLNVQRKPANLAVPGE